MYVCQKRQDKKGARILVRQKLETAWAGKKGKGEMPEKGHRTHERIGMQ